MSTLFYEPLDKIKREIRVLQIIPSSNYHDVVEVVISKRRLEEAGVIPFSYVWGDASNKEEIIVRTPVGKTLMAVTKSLATLLRAARQTVLPYIDNLSDGKRQATFWADAICIDQDNLEERNHQVTLMKSIYGSSRVTVAWLGSDRTSGLAESVFTAIDKEWGKEAQESAIHRQWAKKHPNHGDWMRTYPEFWVKDCQENVGNSYWNAVCKFLLSPFWDRVWTFQEMVLPNHPLLLYGSSLIPSRHLMFTYYWVRNMQNQPPLSFPFVEGHVISCLTSNVLRIFPFARIIYARMSKSIGQSDLNLICVCDSLCATDPRDHIFGLLGLAKTELVADYHKSCLDVYSMFFLTWIREIGNLELLNFSGSSLVPRMGPSMKLPSWVPNWHDLSQQSISERKSSMYGTQGYKFQACSGLSISSVHISEVREILFAPGIQCDEIDQIIPCGAEDNVLSALLEWASNNVTTGKEKIIGTGIPILQLLLRTALLDQQPLENKRIDPNTDVIHTLALSFLFLLLSTESERPGWTHRIGTHLPRLGLDPGPGFARSYRGRVFPNIHVVPQLQGWDDARTALLSEVKKGLAPHIRIQAIQNLRHRSMLVTKRGYVGVASGVRKEDLVVALAGCSVPVILRKKGLYFEHVSTCFILGYMDGEAIERVMAGETDIQTFEIH